MVQKGLDRFTDPAVVELKKPRFDHNDQFDLSAFGTTFTHFMLRSIWTHASKRQIDTMLDAMLRWGSGDAVMLTSFVPTSREPEGRQDYQGDTWVGRSHESTEGGIVAHRLPWIKRACAERGLTARKVRRRPVGGQAWLAVTHNEPA